MKGFMLNEKGDVVIENGEIQFVNDTELIRQTVQRVLGTNKGEWFLDIEQGVTFSNILGKGVKEDIVQNEVLQGLRQVDETFHIEAFSCAFDPLKRLLTVKFTARSDSGEIIEEVQTWA